MNPSSTTQATAQALSAVLADCFSLYLKTLNYHWNVTGHHFKSLHLLFEEQYQDMAESVDEIAERVRTLGQKVEATFSAFQALTQVQPGQAQAKADDMVKELATDQDKVVASWVKALKAAEAAQDEATIDMATRRIAVHEKNRWMLESSLEI